MKLNIEIIADSDQPADMAALAALIASLGGRAAAVMPEYPNVPTTSTTTSGAASEPDDSAEMVDVGAPDLDSAGFPWDERIHAASKATNADGTWRKRRNLDDATYDAVMAELRAAHGATVRANPTQPSSPDTPPPPPTEPAVTAPAAVAAEPVSDPVPPPPASGPDLSTFANFVRAVNEKTHMADGTPVAPDAKTYAKLNELCASTFGVPAFKDMMDRPQDWAMFYDMVG